MLARECPGQTRAPDRALRLALDFDGLSRRYGDVVALDDLSFTVPAGEVVGFLGPNGSGKTTTMRAVFGLVALDAGSVRWNGRPIDAAARRRFGYMPEERGLYPGMLIGEQLQYLARLHGLSSADARTATTRWLERLGVADRATARSRRCRWAINSGCSWRRRSCTNRSC